jgi:hypothetical protein
MWIPPRRHRLLKLSVGDSVTAKHDPQTFAGEVTPVEPNGFRIPSPDGLSYRFAVTPSEPPGKGRIPTGE